VKTVEQLEVLRAGMRVAKEEVVTERALLPIELLFSLLKALLSKWLDVEEAVEALSGVYVALLQLEQRHTLSYLNELFQMLLSTFKQFAYPSLLNIFKAAIGIPIIHVHQSNDKYSTVWS
jgi:hypothetical protein